MALILQIVETGESRELKVDKAIKLPITQDFVIKLVCHEAQRYNIWQINVLRLPNNMSSYTTNESSVPIIGTNAEINELVFELIDDILDD